MLQVGPLARTVTRVSRRVQDACRAPVAALVEEACSEAVVATVAFGGARPAAHTHWALHALDCNKPPAPGLR